MIYYRCVRIRFPVLLNKGYDLYPYGTRWDGKSMEIAVCDDVDAEAYVFVDGDYERPIRYIDPHP